MKAFSIKGTALVKVLCALALCLGACGVAALHASKADAATTAQYEAAKSYFIDDYNHGTLRSYYNVANKNASSENVSIAVGDVATITVDPFQHVQYMGCRMWSRCPDICEEMFEQYDKGEKCFIVGFGCCCDQTPTLEQCVVSVTSTASSDDLTATVNTNPSETLTATTSDLGRTNTASISVIGYEPGTYDVTVSLSGLYFWKDSVKTYHITVTD